MRKKRPRGSEPRRGATTTADQTRLNILDVATSEFASHGLSGARIDEIADRTLTSKQMIYYHFGSKEGLYSAVLEKAYADIRAEESRSDLEHMPPRNALRQLVEFTFDYDENHTKFVSLISIENIHRAHYVAKLPSIREINESIIRTLKDILRRGEKEGVFRKGINAVDLHLLISSFCFYRVSNRHTFEVLFDCDFSEPKTRARQKKLVVDSVMAYVLAPAAVKTIGRSGSIPKVPRASSRRASISADR